MTLKQEKEYRSRAEKMSIDELTEAIQVAKESARYVGRVLDKRFSKEEQFHWDEFNIWCEVRRIKYKKTIDSKHLILKLLITN